MRDTGEPVLHVSISFVVLKGGRTDHVYEVRPQLNLFVAMRDAAVLRLRNLVIEVFDFLIGRGSPCFVVDPRVDQENCEGESYGKDMC